VYVGLNNFVSKNINQMKKTNEKYQKI